MNIYLLGATTITGQAFIKLFEKKFYKENLINFSRNNKKYKYLNLEDINTFIPEKGEKFFIISFVPIWLLAEFFQNIISKKPSLINDLLGIIATSSSSIYTKKFAFSKYDKNLFLKLKNSEDKLKKFSNTIGFSLCIIEPTLIYGTIESYKDKNINLIISIMKYLPFLIIPSQTGMRQPIHAFQLAAVSIEKLICIMNNGNEFIFEKLPLGGDEIISFEEMLIRVNKYYFKNHKKYKCHILKIPNRLFFLLLSPMLLISPKSYEALLRIGTNLSGFVKSSKILKKDEIKFPLINDDFLIN